MIIEKTYTTEQPKTHWFERLSNGKVDIYFTDEVVETEDGFEFLLFKTQTVWTNDFEDRLVNNLEGFNEKARTQTIKLVHDKEIARLKKELQESDYKAIKYIEGFISKEDYEPIRLHRQSLRERINLLEVDND